MIKILTTTLLAGLLAVLFTGCSDKEPVPTGAEEAEIRCRIDSALAPEWACGNAMAEGAVAAVGSAPLGKLGEEFSRREAMASARSNLAQKIQTLVKSKVEKFSHSANIDNIEAADEISKQVAKTTLNGSEQMKQWQNPNTKDIYVLVGVSEDDLNKEIKKQIKNNGVFWQQVQNKQAVESLEKMFP